MGNGAGVAAGNHRQLPTYDYIERLVLKGHFHRNIDDYKEAVEECIKNNEMDILELLIPAGNAASILPLHIAAKLGSIDACELLISAGFDYLAVNVHGHTPLHCCPLNRSNEAILCTTLLGLRGPKAVNMRDKRMGSTPLHIAVENNNTMSVASLLNIEGIIPTMANSFGETPKQLAQKLGHEDIVDLIEQGIVKKMGNGRSGSNGNEGGYGDGSGAGGGGDKKTETPVDEERIMKIWGAFFENAMKQVECEEGLTMDRSGYDNVERTVKSLYNGNSSKKNHSCYQDDEDDNDDNKIDDDYLPSPYRKSSKKSNQKVHYNEKLQKYDYSPDVSLPRTEQSTEHYPDTSPPSQYSSPHVSPYVSPYSSLHNFPHTTPHDPDNTQHTPQGTQHNTQNSTHSSLHDSPYDYTDYEADYGVLAWLDWICCYDALSGRLFVQSVTDGTTAWLDDHLYSQQYWYGLIPPEWSDVSTYFPPPIDCFTLVKHGWMTFFDTTSNDCYWYNIPSEQSLLCLPIGTDPICDSPWGVSLGLCKYENSSEWRTCPHVELCKNSWVAVIAFPQEHSAELFQEYPEIVEEKHYEECKGGSEEKSASRRNSRRDSKLYADEKNETNDKHEKYDHIPSPDKTKEEKKQETVFYFLNKITGTTTWDSPKDWNELVQGPWNGWMLCMSEESHLDLFWWNPESHESRWVQSET